MSVNNIKLSNQQLVDLYENVLIEPLAKDIPKKERLNYLGGNLGEVLIVVNKETSSFLSDVEFEFLSNILAACKLSIADVAIVNWTNASDYGYENVIGELKSKKILLLDLDPIQFGLPLFFPHYQIQSFTNRTFLSAPSLHTLESTVGEKKNFWAALKQLFSL